MVTEAKTWIKENSTLIYFLIAQFIALGAGGATMLAYFTRLETRVSIMETRGAHYTVARMDELRHDITVLEERIDKNEKSINRIVDVLTKRLQLNP